MEKIVEEKFKEIFGTEGRIKTYFIAYRANNEDINEIYVSLRKREDENLNCYLVNDEDMGIITSSIHNTLHTENQSILKHIREIICFLEEKGYSIEHGFDMVCYYKNYKEQESKTKKIQEKLILNILKDMFNLDINVEELTLKNESEPEEENNINTDEKLTIF